MIIEFFEAALFDLKSSKEYYSRIDFDLGDHFLNDIEGAINDIKKHPNASSQHPRFTHLRLKNCKRFPFTIIYHPDFKSNTVFIVAVAHQKEYLTTGLIGFDRAGFEDLTEYVSSSQSPGFGLTFPGISSGRPLSASKDTPQ